MHASASLVPHVRTSLQPLPAAHVPVACLVACPSRVARAPLVPARALRAPFRGAHKPGVPPRAFLPARGTRDCACALVCALGRPSASGSVPRGRCSTSRTTSSSWSWSRSSACTPPLRPCCASCTPPTSSASPGFSYTTSWSSPSCWTIGNISYACMITSGASTKRRGQTS